MIKIPLNSRILSISHLDWDGITAQIVLGQVYKNITYVHCSFYNVDDIMASTDYSLYDYVFITDIHPTDPKKLDLSDKIILLDHHKSASEYHDPSKNRYIFHDKDKCGAAITKKYIEQMYNIRLKKLDNMVRLVNDYDLWFLKHPKSKMMNEVMFFYYRPVKFRALFMDGRTRFTNEEMRWLKNRREDFKNVYKNLDLYEFDKIHGCIVECGEFINDIAHKLMEEEKYEIVVVRNPKNGRVSIRHNIDGFDIGKLLKDYGWGGGHAQSSGMKIMDNNDYKKKILKIEEDILVYKESHQ